MSLPIIREFKHFRGTTEHGVLIITITEPELRGDELAAKIPAELLKAVNHYGSTKVVLDFQLVEYIASLGVAALATFHSHFVKGQGGRVALCRLSPMVRDVLQAVRFISGGSTARVASKDDASCRPESRHTEAETKPLFDMVTPDEATAIVRLKDDPAAG